MLPTDLTTVADFKAAQNIQTTADDAWIENSTNRKFVARQYNGNITADPTKTHALVAPPLRSPSHLPFSIW